MAESKRWEDELRISRSTNTRLLAEITGLRWLLGQHKTDEESFKKLKLQNRLLQEQVLQLKEQLSTASSGSKGVVDLERISSDCDVSAPRLEVGRLRIERSGSSSSMLCAPSLILQSQESVDPMHKLEFDLTAARECMERYERSAAEMTNEVERLRAQSNEAQQQLLSSRLEVARMKQQLWDASNRVESANREVDVLKDQLKAVQQQGKQEQTQHDRYVLTLRDQLDAARKRADSEHQRALELEAELVVMRNKLASNTARIVAMSEDQHKSVAMQKLHVQQLQDEVDELMEALETCEERLASAEEEVMHLRASLKVAQHAANSAVAQYEKLRANLERVAVRNSKQMEESQAAQRVLQETQAALQTANERCDRLEQEKFSLTEQLQQLAQAAATSQEPDQIRQPTNEQQHPTKLEAVHYEAAELNHQDKLSEGHAFGADDLADVRRQQDSEDASSGKRKCSVPDVKTAGQLGATPAGSLTRSTLRPTRPAFSLTRFADGVTREQSFATDSDSIGAAARVHHRGAEGAILMLCSRLGYGHSGIVSGELSAELAAAIDEGGVDCSAVAGDIAGAYHAEGSAGAGAMVAANRGAGCVNVGGVASGEGACDCVGVGGGANGSAGLDAGAVVHCAVDTGSNAGVHVGASAQSDASAKSDASVKPDASAESDTAAAAAAAANAWVDAGVDVDVANSPSVVAIVEATADAAATGANVFGTAVPVVGGDMGVQVLHAALAGNAHEGDYLQLGVVGVTKVPAQLVKVGGPKSMVLDTLNSGSGGSWSLSCATPTCEVLLEPDAHFDPSFPFTLT